MTDRAPLALVLAVAEDGAIGLRGKVPWHIPEDLAHFRCVTKGHAVIMGRRTWDDIGKPLRNRRSIVASRDMKLAAQGVEVARSFEDAIVLARATDPEPRVIGGAQIYRLALPLATRIYLTEVLLSGVEADTFFTLDRTGFRETERRPGADPRVVFVQLER